MRRFHWHNPTAPSVRRESLLAAYTSNLEASSGYSSYRASNIWFDNSRYKLSNVSVVVRCSWTDYSAGPRPEPTTREHEIRTTAQALG